MLHPLTLSLAMLLGIGALGTASAAEAAVERHVQAELVAAREGLQPGGVIWAGLKMKIDKGWHVYWKNPGDTGLPTRLTWKSTGGASPGEIQWPLPKRILVGKYVNLGYEDQVLLPFQLRAPAELPPGSSVTLIAEGRWLVCHEACVPEKAELKLELLAVGARQDAASDSAALFTDTLKRVPVEAKSENWTVKLETHDGQWLFKAKPHFEIGDLGALARELQVLPEDKELATLAPASIAAQTGELDISLPMANPLPAERKSELSIVLSQSSSKSWPTAPGMKGLALRIAAPLPTLTAPRTSSAAMAGGETPLGLAQMLLLAFIGGLILNLMPCVFPVLSIKVLDFVQTDSAGKGAASNRFGIRVKAALYTAGVVLTFWGLAGMLLVFQHAGRQVGWGFQLQSPGFVASLIVLFYLMGLNLLGTFEIGTTLMGAGGSLGEGAGRAAAFFTGVLSVVVASPCTAPFMGVALGFALSQSAFIALLVFTALALGLASPFLLLVSFPKLIERLPRPGMWMGTLKKFLAFPLFASVAWLVWVFDLQVGSAGLVRVLSALVLLGMSAWVYGEWAQAGRTLRVRQLGLGAALVLVLIAAGSLDGAVRPRKGGINWQPYSAERLVELRREGTPVFIDFTAAWCLTCQVNEQVALTSESVIKKFADLKVVALRGDWTNEDPAITGVLRTFGRSGVPLYLYYGKGEPRVLPQILTPQAVIRAIDGP